MVGSEHAATSILDAAASFTRELDAAASNSNTAASTRPETACAFLHARTLKNHHLILEKDFKVIPLEEVP